MNFLKEKLNGFKRRLHCIPYGMFYWKNSDFSIPEIITVNGKKLPLHLKQANIHEFTLICIDDCYHLDYLKRNVSNIKNIVDVGANWGMFLLAARQNFPKAMLTAYEPNPHLKETLNYNAGKLGATVFNEAVMQEDGMVQLNFSDSDLATTAFASAEGNVQASSLQTIIARSGPIDILKLDCEGAEWGLLSDTSSWKQIRSVAMEYHLWGKPGSKMEDLFRLLVALDFKIIIQEDYNNEQGFILAINQAGVQ